MKISIVIPVYNVDKWLDSCLRSVEKQCEKPDEVIIVNDGSTDQSLKICEEYCRRNKTWIVISQENQGLSRTRNVGIDKVTGEFVVFLDSDDVLRLDAVKKIKERALEQYYDAIYYDATCFSDEEILPNREDPYNRQMSFIPQGICGLDYFDIIYPDYYLPSACLCAFRKCVLDDKRIRFPVGLVYEDNYFSFVYISNAKCISYIPEAIYLRRYRKESITLSEMTEKKISDLIYCFRYTMEYINKNIELYEDHRKTMLLFLCNSQEYIISVEKKFDFIYQIKNAMDENICIFRKICNVFLIDIYLYDVDIHFMMLHIYYERRINYKKEMLTRLIEKIVNILKPIKLYDKKTSLTIYGIGKHTDGLLAFYEKYISQITARISFVTTEGSAEYNGQKVEKVTKILYQKVDGIVVSSFKYRKEMLNRLNILNSDIPIYDIYKDIQTDIFGNIFFLL